MYQFEGSADDSRKTGTRHFRRNATDPERGVPRWGEGGRRWPTGVNYRRRARNFGAALSLYSSVTLGKGSLHPVTLAARSANSQLNVPGPVSWLGFARELRCHCRENAAVPFDLLASEPFAGPSRCSDNIRIAGIFRVT